MKKEGKFKRIAIIAVAVLISAAAVAFVYIRVNSQEKTSGDWKFTVLFNEATITGYTGGGGDITIPATISLYSYPVKAIADSAFGLNNKISSIRFEDNSYCESIGLRSFCDCLNLKSVIIPESVKKIGESAFSGCVSLDYATIYNKDATIGLESFPTKTAIRGYKGSTAEKFAIKTKNSFVSL